MQNDRSRQSLHWDLVRLHLFAATAKLTLLQDAAMDALQDLYLRCDWEVSPEFVDFLYSAPGATDLDGGAAVRLRRWVVAMMAWSESEFSLDEEDEDLDAGDGGVFGSASGDMVARMKAGRYRKQFEKFPALRMDYAGHLERMHETRADVRIKNPQLRLPGNKLRSEERFFGFRACSFHSHRSSVREGECPLTVTATHSHSSPSRSPWRKSAEEDSDDATDEIDCTEILSPVSTFLSEAYKISG
jgi:hypothetical protein